jgi:hypothetical protein
VHFQRSGRAGSGDVLGAIVVVGIVVVGIVDAPVRPVARTEVDAGAAEPLQATRARTAAVSDASPGVVRRCLNAGGCKCDVHPDARLGTVTPSV